MANPEHVARILKEGVDAWNRWRENPPASSSLSEAALTRPDLSGAGLSYAYLTHADFGGVDLRGASLREAELSSAKLQRADLSGAELCEAILDAADLSLAVLSRTDLTEANLSMANLYGADLEKAELNSADLTGANLSYANLESADLRWANLADTNLTGANLFGANLTWAVLTNSNFSGVTVGLTIFGGNNLGTTVGLDTVRHEGPSTISIDTIYRSEGKIPETFLRGAGVPEDFMIYVKASLASPIEFYSCFISYSTKDQDFADRLHADLQNKGVRCWFAPHDIQGGKKLHEQIDEAIRLHDKLLLILSPDSIESEWVKTEIAKARRREVRDKRRILFPIRLVPFETLRDWEYFDADTGKDSAREIREYFIPDFSNWKDHDSYLEAFTRLLQDLKAQDSAAAR